MRGYALSLIIVENKAKCQVGNGIVFKNLKARSRIPPKQISICSCRLAPLRPRSKPRPPCGSARDYLLPHTKADMKLMCANPLHGPAEKVVNLLRDWPQKTITRREIQARRAGASSIRRRKWIRFPICSSSTPIFGRVRLYSGRGPAQVSPAQRARQKERGNKTLP